MHRGDEQAFNGSHSGDAQPTHSVVQPPELEVARNPVHVADRPVSVFSSRHGAAPCRCIPQCPPEKDKRQAYHSFPLAPFTLRQVDDYARRNGEAKILTARVRAQEPGTLAYTKAKSCLYSYCPGGVVAPFRAQRCMTVTGLAYCELDSAYDIAKAREALEADPSIARAALSPGGKGFHVVVPVVPEPTNVRELQWALERVHGHMVCRYGALFEKFDRLTSGVDLHYLPSAPDSHFRETALPLMTGAPPSRYTDERRRTVPGFGAGSSGRTGEFGPFEDTTDPACLAWRDRTRRRIRTALEHLDLPAGSRNDVWIPICFCLIAAEMEGRAFYKVSIGARNLFVDWTRAAASPGSTKPDEARDTFDRLAADFDLDRPQVGNLEGLYARARAAGWDGRAADAGDHESADASEQEHETSDTGPGENTHGAESAHEPGSKDHRRKKAKQASDNVPLDFFTKPCRRNIADASNLARLMRFFSEELVIALPDPSDSRPATGRGRRKALPDIYAIDYRGMLSSDRAGALLLKTARLYYDECYSLKGAERHACTDDARKLGNDGVLERLCGVAAAAVHDLRDAGALPEGLVVKHKSEIDCDLHHIGTAEGVLDLRTGHIVPPSEARQFLVVSTTEVSYDHTARHPRHPGLDRVLPPVGAMAPDSVECYRARIIAYCMTHRPHRQFMWELCASGSGKTTFANTLSGALGDAYVQTLRPEVLKHETSVGGATHHNGDINQFAAPSRIIFCPEFAGQVDTTLLKRLTGGDRVSFRPIREAARTIRPTAHLWVQGNVSDDARLGIGGDDDNAAAIRDRAKLLWRERIADTDAEDKSLLLLGEDRDAPGAPEFRAAALARIVDYCMRFHDKGWPEVLPSLAQRLEDQARKEQPLWKRSWLPHVLTPLETEDGEPPTNNKQVYHNYLMWHEANDSGEKPAPTRAIGQAVCKHYEVKPRKGWDHKVRVSIYDGWRLNLG